jgi:3-hydroxyacyl-CoA dehydrogenase/enoyl-CoA hydratase/3-hydroxybutyryl-CoA epimerase
VIFGTGFAPFTGGPMHYLATHGETPAGAAPGLPDDAVIDVR